MNPLISVIIPTYNRADLITATLESFTNQEFSDFEIIIVDDGSTDNTESVVRPYLNNQVFYFKKKNEERAAARNYGVKKAKGKFVNFFDSDDLALSNHLMVAKNMIEENKNTEWFHLGYAWVREKGGRIYNPSFFTEKKTLNNIISSGNVLSCNGVFIRKDIALKYPFNEERILSASEDYELWLRLAARFQLFYSNEVTSLIMDHEERSVRTMDCPKIIKRQLAFLKAVLEDTKVNQVFRKEHGKIKMYAYLYISTHLASQTKFKHVSLYYLLKGLFNSVYIVKTKGFYATLKNLILRWKRY